MRARYSLLIALLLAASTARAAVPNEFSVQGVLRDGAGKLQTMPVDVSVSLFDAQTMGNKLAGPYPMTSVPVSNGLFTVPISDAAIQTELAGAAQAWLEVTVGNDTFARQLITPQVYALLCGTADAVKGVTVLPNGNVGIGTTGPQGALEVHNPSDTEIRLSVVNGVTPLDFQLGMVNSSWFGLTHPLIIQAFNGSGTSDIAITPSTNNPAGGVVIKANGNVGIGTATPAAKLHVSGGNTLLIAPAGGTSLTMSDATNSTVVVDHPSPNVARIYGGNGSTVRLGANGADVMTMDGNGNVGVGQTGPADKLHVAASGNGGMTIQASNSTQLTLAAASGSRTSGFVVGRSAIGGDTHDFFVYDAVASAVRLLIASTGNLAIGSTTPSNARLHVTGPDTTSASYAMWAADSLGAELFSVRDDGVVHVPGTISTSGGLCSCSDARLKTNVQTIEHALDDVDKLRGVRFDWKKDGKHSIGVIAQEVEKVYPELVVTNPDGMKAVDYGKLAGVLIESTKQLRAENSALKARLDRMEARLDRFADRQAAR